MIVTSRHFKPQFRSQLGITMVEIIIYLGLLSGLLMVTGTMVGTLFDAQLESTSTAHIEQTSQFLTARLLSDISQADAVVTPAALGATSANLELQVGEQVWSYAVTGTTLTLTRAGVTLPLHGEDVRVTSTSFTQLGNVDGVPTITATLELESEVEAARGPEVRTLRITSGLR